MLLLGAVTAAIRRLLAGAVTAARTLPVGAAARRLLAGAVTAARRLPVGAAASLPGHRCCHCSRAPGASEPCHQGASPLLHGASAATHTGEAFSLRHTHS